MNRKIKLHVLGHGITAQSVRKAIKGHTNLFETSLEDADWIVASPGMPPSQFPQTNTEIISEIELAYRLFHSGLASYTPKIVGITGTNGKSSITTLISKYSGYPACGNIGVPLIEWFNAPSQPEWLIVELSSYQLFACSQFRPDVAILSSFAEDHLAWHKSVNAYRLAKARLFKNIKDEPVFLTEAVYKHFPELSELTNVQAVKSSAPHLAPHLDMNLSLANACLSHLGKPKIVLKDNFESVLPHRLEKLETQLECCFINDSKSTNPESCLAAIAACSKPLVLILCGEDKQLDLFSFYQQVFDSVDHIIVFGALKSTLHAYTQHSKLSTVENVAEAVQLAYNKSNEKMTILFSPSSSSYDQFNGFEQRGHSFKQAVKDLERCIETNS